MDRIKGALRRVLPACVLLLAACGPPSPREVIFEPPQRQQQIRNLQSHLFSETDRIRIMRAVIVTLQDLDFVITQADSRLGYIGAVRLQGYSMHVTIKVDDMGADTNLVRVSLAAGLLVIPDDAYQEFFASVQKNLALPPVERGS